jgi:DNA processing protein
LLFSLGQASPAQITAPQQKAIAIVGTRQPSPEAHQFALDCASVLAQHNTTIVSGLALGIDTYAHQGALTGGHTLAVMGSGVLNVYPPSNKAIADVIRIRGALLSENAPNAHATAPRLVARNRLISGLADALIVVQTAPDGGAMHAARFARQQNKPVFALDAPFAGNQQLIEQGATPLNPQLLGEPLQLLNIFGV